MIDWHLEMMAVHHFMNHTLLHHLAAKLGGDDGVVTMMTMMTMVPMVMMMMMMMRERFLHSRYFVCVCVCVCV